MRRSIDAYPRGNGGDRGGYEGGTLGNDAWGWHGKGWGGGKGMGEHCSPQRAKGQCSRQDGGGVCGKGMGEHGRPLAADGTRGTEPDGDQHRTLQHGKRCKYVERAHSGAVQSRSSSTPLFLTLRQESFTPYRTCTYPQHNCLHRLCTPCEVVFKQQGISLLIRKLVLLAYPYKIPAIVVDSRHTRHYI